MGIMLHLITCLACIQAILSHPLQENGSPLFEDYNMALAKRDSYYPFKESLLSTLGFLQNSKEGSLNQRKKAVDSTFIRFGRSSSSEATFRPNTPNTVLEEEESSLENSKSSSPQRYILNHNGCRISSSQELVKALMNDRNCIRAFQKVKRENVNDTFIRFGKRSVPSIAEASLLFYSTPIFTIIIGHLFLKEYCRFTEILATMVSICGVCFVCVPQFAFNYSTSVVIGITGSLIGALAQAIALALIRKITFIPPFVVSFWWASVGILFSTVFSTTFKEVRPWNCGWETTCLAFIAVVGFISEVSLVSALKSTDAVLVSLALTTEIVWAFILQYFANCEVPSTMTLIGGAIIGISLLLPPTVDCTYRNKNSIKGKNMDPESK